MSEYHPSVETGRKKWFLKNVDGYQMRAPTTDADAALSFLGPVFT